MHAVAPARLNESDSRCAGGRGEICCEAGKVADVGRAMRVSEILKRVLLRHVGAANAQVLLIPPPGQTLGCQLISDVLKRIPGAGLSQRIARRKEGLDRERHVVVVGGDKEELVGWGITHDGWEKIVRQGKLLRPVPQDIHPGSGVVIMPHGDWAVEKSVFVHRSAVPYAEKIS